MEERRKQYCPEHEHHYLCREGDNIICCGFNCNWQVVAKREEDKLIPKRDDWR